MPLQPFTRRALLALPAVRLCAAQPRMTAVPLPYEQVSFQREGREIARLHYSPALNRPFVYPVIGPSGRTLTRMGHPGDPHSHSHHNSVWVSLKSVNGVDFWSDHLPDGGRIVVQEVTDLMDGDNGAGVVFNAHWLAPGAKVLLRETRETWAYPLSGREWLLVIDLLLAPGGETPATLEPAGFGPIGVRMAKSMSGIFGDGVIRNSEGGAGERAIFRKPARWVDYSGSVADGVREGLTLMDHPGNPTHPAPFHVREDGWMGALLSLEKTLVVSKAKPVHLRYGVWVHAGAPEPAAIEQRWKAFAALDLRPPYGPPRTARDCQSGNHRRFTVPRRFSNARECIESLRPER